MEFQIGIVGRFQQLLVASWLFLFFIDTSRNVSYRTFYGWMDGWIAGISYM
ncbi:MAG: hypothetical protein JRI67_05830 [Deltaproteobacteria bacterium]|nr:hypothetical protein [Deltaproteobacteria bacterium]MBW1964724.1 hypothetical protein [Deltaproteobacteria bacterium]